MAMKKKPVTGMKDILPQEMQIREYVLSLIKETYGNFGFSQIETPCVEHIENLSSKQGGDNEKLIFKIMKRGEKLKINEAETENDLADSGLRYDLTLPLSRYYANNAANLPAPFKALQMGSVWRADRPQKGRFRQFMQCDIDILGEPSSLAEIELVLATSTLLGKLNFKNFNIRINDRKILKGMSVYSGFDDADFDKLCIIVDKMDKIGLDGVENELLESGFDKEKVEKYIQLFRDMDGNDNALVSLGETLKGSVEEGVFENLINIVDSVNKVKTADFNLVFDPTLVRGMSYYTGPIFEIEMAELNSSVGGGGRYDEMIGKFSGQSVCACGFSVGFERIVTILMDQDFKVPGNENKKAFLIEKGMPADKVCAILEEATALRENGQKVLVVQMNKNKKFQKEQLAKDGYTDIKEYFAK